MDASAGRVYVYSAPGYDVDWLRVTGTESVEGRGRLKIGYTGRPESRVRVKEQTGTVYPDGEGVVIHLDEPALRDDKTPFTDHDVHKILVAAGVNRTSEVFEATLDEVHAAIVAVRTGRPYDPSRTGDFGMRPEQAEAVERTAKYFINHAGDPMPPRFLWNAKMRFGKTFTTYQLANRMGWNRVLVLTYKPAVRNSWRDDLVTHVDFDDWVFADRDDPCDLTTDSPVVWFASFQDFLGTTNKGEVKEHNLDLHAIDWDCVVLDEYHFGAWQGAAKEVCAPASTKTPKNAVKAEENELEEAAEQADEVEDMVNAGTPRLLATTPDDGIDVDIDASQLKLTSSHYLYLSGTPFRALTEGEFNEDAIFNWTYSDEQAAKQQWDEQPSREPERNPYRELPQMQMYTYVLAETAIAEIEQRADGMFDLSGYFEAKRVGSEYQFTDSSRVNEFLNMLRGRLSQSATEKLLNNFKPPFPYSDARFAEGIEHSVWLMPTIASCHAMKAALESHPYFRDFLIHVAAGNSAKIGAAAKEPVDAMLSKAATLDKQTITLSCGKLMTGVTIPPWGSIFILRSLKSPESYFQAAFRVQSPWTVKAVDGTREVKKNTCFVFDFDPNRALSLVYQYGTKLAGTSTETAPADVIQELIDFLPIFAFDGGRMDPIDVNAVMDWGTAGAGAAMLAKRWGSPRLIDLSEGVLMKLLANSELVDRLQKLEDFRNLRDDANKIISQSKKLKVAKKKGAEGGEPEDDETKAARKAKRDQVKTLRAKLLKFIQRIPVFMYLTDFREQALVHVIDSLDTQLFERVTNLTLDDFHELAKAGVFHPGHMNEAIWQFRLFESASIDYLGSEVSGGIADLPVGLWDHVADEEEIVELTVGNDQVVAESIPLKVDERLALVVDQGLLSEGDELAANSKLGLVATVTGDYGIEFRGVRYVSPEEAAFAASSGEATDGWSYWTVIGYGTLKELADLAADHSV
ncbi:restriction endonuclease [Arthrobacter rhombi]